MTYTDFIATYRNKITSGFLRNSTKIFFCHVPKCAGTALSRAIARQAYPKYQALLVPNFSVQLGAAKDASIVCSLPKVDARQVILSYHLSLDKYKFGTGHVYCRPKLVNKYCSKWHFVTILRNPVDRWISEYTYNTYKSGNWAKNTLSLEDYVQSEKGRGTGESFLRYFSSIPYPYSGDPQMYIAEAIENLMKFSVVGTVERFDDWCSKFERVFGKKLTVQKVNTNPRKAVAEQITNDRIFLERVAELCESDLKIYDYFRKEAV